MSAFYPEAHISFSPSLAVTLGLEEAIMLQVLRDSSRLLPHRKEKDACWFQLEEAVISTLLPFWSTAQLQQFVGSLRDKGILLVDLDKFSNDHRLDFAFYEGSTQSTIVAAQSTTATPQRGQRLESNWKPNDAVLSRLAQQGVPRDFSQAQCAEFIQYWRERNETHPTWDNKFTQHVMRKWRDHENSLGHQKHRLIEAHSFASPNPLVTMTSDWYPSQDALQLLVEQAGIHPNFIEDAIPEFLIRWQETGEKSNIWNSRFIQHVKRQWARFQHTLENDTEPQPISIDWQPSQDVYEVLELANIDLEFARNLLREFIIYWRDRNELKPSWNTTFIQYVKLVWARQQRNLSADGNPNRTTRERSLEEDLNDRSWAE